MKKNIWIMNHYAGGMDLSKGGRHGESVDQFHRDVNYLVYVDSAKKTTM